MNLNQHVLASTSRLMSRVLLTLAALLVGAVVGGSPALAQDRGKPTNLKVLDTTLTHDQLIGLMSKYSSALGVGCDHCHAEGKGPGQGPNFASDDNKVKLTARAMIQMVNQINATYINTKSLPNVDTPVVAVQCVTCHHGQPRPMLIQDVLKKARKDHGMAAADSTYRDLRKEYYGGFTYDFDDQALVQLALEIMPENGKDAMAFLKLNGEFNPKSAPNEWAMGHVYVSLADTASAVASFKKALEINPDFRRAKRELDMLSGNSGPKH
jgi:hypothetical protein